MPTMLKDLVVDEVSSVDRGAGEGVRIMMMKRDYSADDRRAMASSGEAMHDGSFPIKNAKDVKDAVSDWGRAGSSPSVKAHIIARARALGCTDALPDGWVGKSIVDGAVAMAGSLVKSAISIIKGKDDNRAKAEALDKSLGEFAKNLSAMVPAELEKASQADIAKDAQMTDAEKAKAEAEKKVADCKKALEAAQADLKKAKGGAAEPDTDDEGDAPTKKLLAKALVDIAVLKMSPIHQQYLDASGYDEKNRKVFAEMNPDERDEHMAKNPIIKSAKPSLPPEVVKALSDAAADRVELRKLKEKSDIADFAKRAIDIGMTGEQGELLRKAHGGDIEALTKVEQYIKGLHNQIETGALFDRFSKAGGNAPAATAKGQFEALAKEHKAAQDKLGKRCTEAQAFVKVYTDPSNAELKKRYDDEESSRRARAA